MSKALYSISFAIISALILKRKHRKRFFCAKNIKTKRLNKKEFIIALFLLALIAISIWAWLQTGKPKAPETTFATITGEMLPLNTLSGKPVIVTFWATSCPGCMKEIPHLIELYQKFHPQGLEIIAVAMAYDRPDHVIAMVKNKNMPYKIALDTKGLNAKAFGDIRLTPTTFLISPAQTIELHQLGNFDTSTLTERINQLL